MTAQATSLGRVAVLVSVAAAGWLLFTDVHRFQLSDSLLPALVSLQAWTPYFWGQERLGMLGPLLALPFRDPMTNLLVQSGVYALAGFGVANLLARVMTSASTLWASAGAIVALALLLGLGEQDQFRWFLLHHEYSLGLSVGLLGLLAWPRGQALASADVGVGATLVRRAVAALLLLVAQWVNVSMVVPLSVLVLGRQMVADPGTAWSRREARRLLFVVVMGFALNLVFARSQGPARYPLLPVGEWPMGIGSLASNAAAGGWATLAIVASVAAVAVVIWWARGGPREVAVDAIRLAAPLGLMSVAHLAFMGTLAHVVEAGSNSRYAFTALATLCTALALGAMVLIYGVAPRFADGLCRTLLVAVVPVVAAVHGAPGTSRPRAQLDAAWGEPARQLLAAGCTHVLGTGAHVWPTVFVAMVLESEDGRAGARQGPWGIEFRDGPTSHVWRGWPRESFRIAFLREDARWTLDTHPRERGLGVLELVETRQHIEVYRPLPESAP